MNWTILYSVFVHFYRRHVAARQTWRRHSASSQRSIASRVWHTVSISSSRTRSVSGWKCLSSDSITKTWTTNPAANDAVAEDDGVAMLSHSVIYSLSSADWSRTHRWWLGRWRCYQWYSCIVGLGFDRWIDAKISIIDILNQALVVDQIILRKHIFWTGHSTNTDCECLHQMEFYSPYDRKLHVSKTGGDFIHYSTRQQALDLLGNK